jgi:hypothetical protein
MLSATTSAAMNVRMVLFPLWFEIKRVDL